MAIMSKFGGAPISPYVRMALLYLIMNGFICHTVKLEVFITGQENKIPQISSTLQFSNLCFTKLWAYYLIVNIFNFCAVTSKGWNQYYTIICEVEPLFSIFFQILG